LLNNVNDSTLKNRTYHYIKSKTGDNYDTQHVPIESEDKFDGELVLLAIPIELLDEMNLILPAYGLRADSEYFYEQCREVISVPENHINAKGEGSLTFQTYFHNFPESVKFANSRAIVVVALHPKAESQNGLKDYWLVHYGHANVFDFKNAHGDIQEAFYYNMLRVSERAENGVKIYRRKKIFTLIFSIFHSLVEVYGVNYAYAAMGKENQAIVEALKLNSVKYQKHFEQFPIRTNTVINVLFDSKSAASQLIDITNNTQALEEMYNEYHLQKGSYIFQTNHTLQAFLKIIADVKAYSKTSKVFMVDKNGKKAFGLVINYGDYLRMTLQNPKGIFKFIASLKLTDNLLYPILLCGDTTAMETLLKGVAYYYRKNHKCYISLLSSYAGDPYWNIKKSIVFDEYQFFVITDRIDLHEANKNGSATEKGDVRYFIDNIII
jgi:hypothetical protein